MKRHWWSEFIIIIIVVIIITTYTLIRRRWTVVFELKVTFHILRYKTMTHKPCQTQ